MADHFHYSPITGVEETFDFDEDTGTSIIHKRQDVEPLMDRLKEIRATGGDDHKLRNDDYFCLYAQIPTTVYLDLKKQGYDLDSRDQSVLKKCLQKINADYPMLKATYKTHA